MKRIIIIVLRVILLVPYWVFDAKRHRDFEKYTLQQRYTSVRKKVISINKNARVKVKAFGVDNLPKKNGYLLTPNHQGLEDPLALCISHPRPIAAIVKVELMKVFFIKDILTVLGCIPLDRKDVRAAIKVIKLAASRVKAGENFIVFPEGTRSKNKNELAEFKGGSFKIATSAKVPIVPVALIDCFKVFDINSIQKQTVEVHYLTPLYYDEYCDMQTNEIAVEVQRRIENHIKKVLDQRGDM